MLYVNVLTSLIIKFNQHISDFTALGKVNGVLPPKDSKACLWGVGGKDMQLGTAEK